MMKKNKLYILLFSVLVPLVWFSCSKELPTENPTDPTAKGKYQVSFGLEKGYVATPKTYASVSAYEGERKITEMCALVFNANDGKFIGAPLHVNITNQEGEDNGTTDSKLKGSFDLGANYGAEGKKIKFILVANVSLSEIQNRLNSLVTATSSVSSVNDLTLDHVKALEITNAPGINNHFVMLSTKEYQVTLQENIIQNVTSDVIMKRLAARIDIYANNNLTVKKVVVKKSEQESYLYEKAGSTTHLSSAEEDKSYDTLGDPNFYTAYTYENSQAAATHLEVTLALDNVELKPITVPFTGIAIERNHIYKVTFNRDPSDTTNPTDPQNPGRITFKIDVNDWNKASTNYVDDYANTSAPVIHSVTAKQSNWTTDLSNPTITVESENKLVRVNSQAHYLAVEVHSKSTQSEAVITSGDAWISVNDVTTYTAGMQQLFQVKVEPNTGSEERTATIEFKNKIDPTKKVIFTVIQSAPSTNNRPKLALEYVAEYNLAPNGTDFTNTHEYMNNEQGYFTWNQALEKSATISGYHLPNEKEWLAIFSNSPNIIRLNESINYSNISEIITIAGETKGYTADYKGSGNGIAYAIKMKGHGDTQRTAYRYRFSGTRLGSDYRLVIDAIYLGNDPSIDINTVAQESFWTTPDATREFPTAGNKYTSVSTLGKFGSLWTAGDNVNTYAWYIFFGDNISMSGQSSKSLQYSVRLFKNAE